jgi:hemerythrin-like domain-containing protein
VVNEIINNCKKINNMKRNQNLITLSWEHHDGLVVAFRLQKGLKNHIATEKLSYYILYVWEQVLSGHFWQEEQTLIAQLAKTTESRAALEKMKTDHNRFRQLIEDLKSDMARSDHVNTFSSLLNQHIRFEERDLFPLLENECSPEELSHIGDFLKKHHKIACLDWQDKFWEKV